MMKKFLCLAAALSVSAGGLVAQDAAPPILGILVRTLTTTEDSSTQLNVLRGMNAALKGKRDVKAPAEWSAVYEKLSRSESADIRREAQALSAIFGGGGALDELRKALADPKTEVTTRRAALDSLVNARDRETFPLLLKIAEEPGELRIPVLRAFASFEDDAVSSTLLRLYPTLSTDERRAALSTLLARAKWAGGLLAAVDQKQVPRTDITAPLARQLQALNDPKINEWLATNWGAVRASSETHQAQIKHFKTFLTPASFETADPSRGRTYFAQLCMSCHSLFGSGGNVGPELTGAYTDVDYLLQNVIDPNAIVGKDYQQTTIQTKSGQYLAGIINGEEPAAVTLKTLAGPVQVQRSDIAELTTSNVSMMPEGLLSALADDEIRDLFAYLQQHGQIPMLVTANTVNDFFNGVDLKTWHASSGAWTTVNGAIVGKGNGKTPEFLTSDMVAQDYQLTVKVRLSGAQPVAEIAVRGHERDGTFEGASLSFGSDGMVELVRYQNGVPPKREATPVKVPLGEWTEIQITAHDRELEVSGGGERLKVSDLPGEPRSVISLYVLGAESELSLKDIKLELLPKNR